MATLDLTKAIPIPASAGAGIPQPVANGTQESADAFTSGATPEQVQAAGVQTSSTASPQELAAAIRPPQTSLDLTKAIPIPGSAIPQAPGQVQGGPIPKPADAITGPTPEEQAAQRSAEFKDRAYKKVWADLRSKNMHDAANDVATLFHNPDERDPLALGKGVAKGAGQTGIAVASAINKIPIVGETLASSMGGRMPSGVPLNEFLQTAEKKNTPENSGEEMGVTVESLAEFMMGDEGLKALEGLSYAKKLKTLLPYIAQLEENPRMLKIVHAAYNTAKMAGLGAASGAVHASEGERAEGALEGAAGGAIGGAAGEALGAGIEALAKPGAEAAGIKPGLLRPGTEEVAGSQIPVRAEGKVANVAESAMSDAQKARLQGFEVNQTQPAVRSAVSGVASEAGGAEAATTAGKADPLGFGGQAEGLRAKAKPSFEAVDTASDGAFSKAQKEADLARNSLDFEGKKAYAAAIEKQNQIWDSVIAMADKGDTPEVAEQYRAAKGQWRRSVGMDELATRFNRSVHPAPADIVKASGGVDNGYINPKQFREGITDAIQSGEFEKAGFAPSHIQKLEDLGNVLARQEVKFTGAMGAVARLARLASEGGVGAGISAVAHAAFPPLVAAPAAMVAGEGIRWTAAEIASRMMSNPKAIEALTTGLRTGASADSIGVRLWNLLKSERGEAEIPGTGKMGTVGTAEGAKADTNFFKRAQAEKPNASLSEQIQHADKLKQDAKTNGNGLTKAVKAAAPFADDAVAAANKLKPVDFVTKGANDYNKKEGLPSVKHEPAKVDRRTADIADAFEAMKHDPTSPAVKKSYEALKTDVRKQWDYAQKKLGVKFEPTDVDPYHSEKELLDDVEKNHRMKVWRGGNPLMEGHPLAETDPKTGENYNTMFRAVHDLFGHAPAANDFSEAGEEAAWNAHRQMFSKEAIPALTTETRGQTSWFYNNKAVRAGEPLGKFAEQKAGILPDFAHNQTPEPGTSYKYNPDLAATNNAHTVTTAGPNGEKIGELVAQDTGNAKRGQVTVRSNQVYDPANRGQGLGQKHIETLIDEVSKNPDIKTVKSDISTTPDAQRVWEKLEQKYPHAIEKKMVGKGDSAKLVWTVDLDAMREDKAAGPVPQGAAPVLPTPEMRTPGTRISQRSPTAAKATEDPVAENLLIGRDAFNKANAIRPGYKADLAELVSKYPGIKIDPTEARLNPDKALDKFTKHIADNLVWLHDQIPENIRNISKLWYDSAHELTKNWAKDYGLEHEQMAGMIAALSPQNEWNNNIEIAKRVADIARNHQNTPWEQEMETNAQRILAKQDPEADIHQIHNAVRGKKMSELTDPLEKAWWLRLYDESFNPRQHLNYAPDGSTRGYARTPVGQRLSTTKWSSLDAIAKAISITEDGSKGNISAKLGDAHKIRNFYNNIIDPWSKHGDVTIDTHAVGAGHLRPMGGSTEEVAHNFGMGGGGVPSSSVLGTQGTYGVYADAYRQAAARLGILPRELQSITWEGIRALYESAGKTDELKTKIAQIWKDHKNGEITIDRARKQILKDAGGFKRPKWAVEPTQPDSGVAPKKQPASDTGIISRVRQA